MRAAFYLRTSSVDSNISNQTFDLAQAAAQRGWQIIGQYEDKGISGAKGREDRPALHAALKGAVMGKYDVLMTWSVDRLGRSLVDLLKTMHSLRDSKVQMYIHRQAIDTSTPHGAAMFSMLGVFAEFERETIKQRILTGMARARAEGKRVGAGKPPIPEERKAEIANLIKTGGCSLREIAVVAKVAVSTVHKIKRELFL